MTVTSMTGAGLTWVLVRRTNVQLGTAEVWRAFAAGPLSGVTVRADLSQSVAASLTIVSFAGADLSGSNGAGAIGATVGANANAGAPSASLVTTRDNSWVFGVGNDYDHAVARVVPSNQTLVNQYLATVDDTYWVQRQNAPTATSGTAVTINDTGPTTDRYNLTVVEVLVAPPSGASFTISGSITPASLGAGSTVTLSQAGRAIAVATANASGLYSFTGVANGSYTLTPTKSGVSFTPASQSVTVNGAALTVAAFSATASTGFGISGSITPASLGAGTTVTLRQSGSTVAVATANANGIYGFNGVPNGSYTVTPSKSGVGFSPTFQAVTVNGAAVTVAAFTATATSSFGVSGAITPASLGVGTTVTLSQGGGTIAVVTANANGLYSFTGVANGTYAVTPTKSGVSFAPTTQSVTVNGAPATLAAFVATAQAAGNRPDLSVIVPVGRMSIAGTGSSRVFQYTHDTFNGGTGPLVIQPEYNAASGTYLGTQYVYTLSGGTWTITQRLPIAGSFLFHAAHGHFHFPFATFGLYAVAADGGPGAPVAISEKNGFCIADSFIYAPNLPNAGALGNLGSCSDPTSLRGLDIGAVDEYDKSDPGQSISIANVPDGTYWLRAIVDPDNFLFESNKSNNETDVLLTISGNTVTELRQVTPVLAPPPAITLTSPVDQSNVAGVVNLTAYPSGGTPVQYLLNGQALGGPVPAPYTLAWDTTTVPDGVSWLAAQTTDPTTGRTGTSSVARVTVANGGTRPPIVSVTSPDPGATVFAITALGATVAATSPITRVQFFIDGLPVGPQLTAPPYLYYWNSRTTSDGTHTLTASATDSFGLTGTSAPVAITVDNSHPANTIGIDALVFSDAAGVMTTPSFSTSTTADLLVAFVAYDGPSNTAQSASVGGAGQSWSLLMRSNSQRGTSEIWVAKASFVLSGVAVTSQPTVAGYHGSLVVVAFSNAAGTGVVGRAGAPSGAPDIVLPGVSAGNWVFAVGNDWDNAVGRVPVAGQVLVHQRTDSAVGDTFWVQSTATPSAANALVDIHDSSPTTDQWNYAAVEIVATRP